MVVFLAYLACVPMANWLIGHAGTICTPSGVCLIPVGFGLSAPSGVLVIGVGLVLRDLLQRTWGLSASLVAIVPGVILSWIVADHHIALASAVTFLFAESAEALVYTPLQRRGLLGAVIASGIAGSVIDSAVFLWLAFGSWEFLAGQIVGKTWAVLMSAPLIYASRRIAIR